MDFHCHIDLYSNPKDVIERAKKEGTYILSVTTTPKAFPGTKRLAHSAPRIRTALGLHPQIAADRISELKLFDLMVRETDYVGEVGLDGSREYRSSFEIQLQAFRYILDSCEAIGGKVLSIHSRSAATAVLEELETRAKSSTPILHWFSGTQKELQRAISLDCWFSVGPAMLRSEKGIQIARKVPRNRLLLETDGPFAKLGKKVLFPEDTQKLIPQFSQIWNCSEADAFGQLSLNLRSIGHIAKYRV